MTKINLRQLIHDIKNAYVTASGDTEEITYGNIAEKVANMSGGDSMFSATASTYKTRAESIDGIMTVIETGVKIEKFISSNGVDDIYIDTKYIPTDNTKVVIDFEYNELKEWNMPFGIRDASNSSHNLYLYANSSGTCYTGWGNKDSSSRGGFFTKGKRQKLTFSKGEIVREFVNTYEIKNYYFSANTLSTNKSIYIFKGNVEDAPIDNFKLYAFQIYEGDELKMDLIPAKVGEECGMHDNVTGEFFKNAGTGKFTCSGI